jgi:hypothetical protein
MVPVGLVVPEPVTVKATETAVLSTIEVLAGETLTVGVVLAVVPPPLPELPPLLLLLVGEDEPQPTKTKPMLAARNHAPRICLHFLVRPGTKKIRRASTPEPPAALNHCKFAGEDG